MKSSVPSQEWCVVIEGFGISQCLGDCWIVFVKMRFFEWLIEDSMGDVGCSIVSLEELAEVPVCFDLLCLWCVGVLIVISPGRGLVLVV